MNVGAIALIVAYSNFKHSLPQRYRCIDQGQFQFCFTAWLCIRNMLIKSARNYKHLLCTWCEEIKYSIKFCGAINGILRVHLYQQQATAKSPNRVLKLLVLGFLAIPPLRLLDIIYIGEFLFLKPISIDQKPEAWYSPGILQTAWGIHSGAMVWQTVIDDWKAKLGTFTSYS